MNLLDITHAMFLPTLATREMLRRMLRTLRVNMVESSPVSAAQAAALLLWLRFGEGGDMQTREPEMRPLVTLIGSMSRSGEESGDKMGRLAEIIEELA